MTVYQFALSEIADPVNYLVEYGVPAPYQHFQKYSEGKAAADGTVTGRGWSWFEWYWNYLSQTHRDIIKAFCADDLSAEVYARTLDEELVWHTYRCRMVWPVESPDIQNSHSMKVSIRFIVLEQMD